MSKKRNACKKNLAKPAPAKFNEDQKLTIAVVVREERLAMLDNIAITFANLVAEIKADI